MQLKHYPLNSLTIALILGFTFTDVFSQDSRIVHQFNSFGEFNSEIDTLKMYQLDNHFKTYDYLIRYFEIRKVHNRIESYGSIVIKGDSIFSQYHSMPSIVGDPFGATPLLSDSASKGIIRKKIEKKDRKWVKSLEHLSGFYSQNTRLGNKEFYPRNWIRCLVIFNKSGVCFGVIKYGSYDIDYQVVGKSESEPLKELIDFVF